jgi:uncharacterized protein YjiS (DUF1127 family)
MQHRPPAQGVAHFIVSPFIYFDEAFDSPRSRTARRRRESGFATTIIGAARALWKRARERRELVAMRDSDLRDLSIPQSLVADEARRWPWQRQSPRWANLRADEQSGFQVIFRPFPRRRRG